MKQASWTSIEVLRVPSTTSSGRNDCVTLRGWAADLALICERRHEPGITGAELHRKAKHL